jgi:hypothetical protein
VVPVDGERAVEPKFCDCEVPHEAVVRRAESESAASGKRFSSALRRAHGWSRCCPFPPHSLRRLGVAQDLTASHSLSSCLSLRPSFQPHRVPHGSEQTIGCDTVVPAIILTAPCAPNAYLRDLSSTPYLTAEVTMGGTICDRQLVARRPSSIRPRSAGVAPDGVRRGSEEAARCPRETYIASLLTDTLGPGPAVTAAAHIPDLHYFSGRGGKDIIPPASRCE